MGQSWFVSENFTSVVVAEDGLPVGRVALLHRPVTAEEPHGQGVPVSWVTAQHAVASRH